MAASCQLYLSVPAGFSGEPALIAESLAITQAPSLLIVGEGDPKRVAAIIDAAHRQNAIVLTDDRVMLTAAGRFDGLHLPLGGMGVAEARELVGGDGVIGVECRLSRHEAMSLAEAGADYIAFGSGGEGVAELAEMASWWGDLIEIPCAVYLPGDAGEAAWQELAAAGADFVMPGAEIWEQPEQARERLRRLALYCGAGQARGPASG